MSTEKKDGFFKKAFKDMGESAKEQHKLDKANFNAVKAEGKANWEEAKVAPNQRQAMMKAEHETGIADAEKRKADADERVLNVKNGKNTN